jgi:hypothetical protein
MKPLARYFLAAALTGLLATPAHAEVEDQPSAGAMVADVIVARPLGLVATTIGAAAFIVSLPFSALGGNVDQAADKLVMGPARETFVRCLGCPSAGRQQRM